LRLPGERLRSLHDVLAEAQLRPRRSRADKARWYRNRYVGYPRVEGAPPDRRRGRNNTHVVQHAGKLLALVEAALPLELDGELATVVAFDFGGAVETAVTAHPKTCPRTGELHFFGYQFRAPHLVYYVADAEGRLLRRHDAKTGESRACDLGADQMPGECAVAGAWLTYVYDASRDGSDLVVLSAEALTPVARVRLPQRVPFGFHGSWIGAA